VLSYFRNEVLSERAMAFSSQRRIRALTDKGQTYRAAKPPRQLDSEE
jgi:hypothetical protein